MAYINAFCIVLYCIVLYCIVLYCIVLGILNDVLQGSNDIICSKNLFLLYFVKEIGADQRNLKRESVVAAILPPRLELS